MYSILYYSLALALFCFVLTQVLLILGRVTGKPVFEYYGRTFSGVLALIICSLYGTIASAVLNVVGKAGLGQWTTARAFKYVMSLFTGVWFTIDDEKDYLGRTRPAVFVGNHQSELDILFLGHMFPKYCSVTAKKSLMYMPFLGWFMTMSKTVFIERSSREQAVAAFAKAAEQMSSIKQSVFIFPEGTRSYYDHPDLLSFKKGAFHLAIQAQVPIVPVVAANYAKVLNTKTKVFRPGTIEIKVLAPIETKGKGKDDVDALMEETREKMLATLKTLHVEAQEETMGLKDHLRMDGGAHKSALKKRQVASKT